MVTAGNFLKKLVFGTHDVPEDERRLITAPSVQERSRHELLADVCGFLLENDLEISERNLLTAHRAATGGDPQLARQVRRQREEGVRITQEWLDDAGAEPAKPDAKETDRLIEQLGQGIDTLSRITSEARDSTLEYSDALEKHMAELHLSDDTGALIVNLAGYARGMLERSRKAEDDLRKSENEVALLRRDLDRARHDAEIDHLTGLPNRRAFEKVLAGHLDGDRPEHEEMCIAFCDIDRFKTINDTHGHAAGDRVIRLVGDMLAHISTANCCVARHGGEEFAVLFPGASPTTAFQALDEVREGLARRQLINRASKQPFGQVTFSAGIASFGDFPDPRDALFAADEALYEAKENGRNQVRIAGDPGPASNIQPLHTDIDGDEAAAEAPRQLKAG